MHFRNQFSITSKTGVGSSSLFKELRKRWHNLPYRWVSGGALFRAKAAELGMSVEEFARHNRLHPEEGHDEWVDKTITHFANQDYVVCESRLSHFFMPHAFKVLLVCPLPVRVVRRHADSRNTLFFEVARAMEGRDRDDDARYAMLYPGCIWGEDRFDLVLNTAEKGNSSDVLAHKIESAHTEWLRKFDEVPS